MTDHRNDHTRFKWGLCFGFLSLVLILGIIQDAIH
jgi:hypothetical protein